MSVARGGTLAVERVGVWGETVLAEAKRLVSGLSAFLGASGMDEEYGPA